MDDNIHQDHYEICNQSISKYISNKEKIDEDKDVLVSCIVPTHNRSDLLPRAIRSIQKQTYKNIEIIVVSDGSTDNTDSIMEDLCQQDERIRFIKYSPAQGGNFARNRGIQEAQGDYIAFLDDDDEWLDTKLDKQIDLLKRNKNIGMSYTGVRIIYVDENMEYSFIGKADGDLSKEILFSNVIGTTSSVLIKKEILLKCGGFDNNLKAAQDHDLWIRICQVCKIGVVSEKLINYYNYSSSHQISTNAEKYVCAYKYIEDKYSDLYSKLTKREMEKRNINMLIGISNKYLRNGFGKKSREILKSALKIKISIRILIYYLLSYFKFSTILKIRSFRGSN